jgi:hypothetical protein
MIAEEHEGLQKIRRLRFALWALLVALIPLIWLVTRYTQSYSVMMCILIIWVAAAVHFAARVAFSPCPRCRNCFHATTGTPSFWNLFARRCTHCGLSLRSDRVMYPGMT